MKNLKSKGGISLIVLVITIIVMIILATAIILSLSNSGIIGKANKAKTDSDTASLKEYVNTLKAEYELMTLEERNGKTFAQYANSKLETSSFKDAYIDEDETIYASLDSKLKSILNSGLKIGDTVAGYTVTSKSYTTGGTENTASNYFEGSATPQTVSTNTNITWKYMGINEDGQIEIVADLGTNTVADNTKVNLSGKGGYLNGPDMLNTICKELYSVAGKGTARSMNIEDVNKLLGYTGNKGGYNDSSGNFVKTDTAMTIADITSQKNEPSLSGTETPDNTDVTQYKSNYYTIHKTDDISKISNKNNVQFVYSANNEYWLASSCSQALFQFYCVEYAVRYVGTSKVDKYGMYLAGGSAASVSYAVRPVVKIDSSVSFTYNSNTNTLTLS